MTSPRRTALVVVVEQAEQAVSPWRLRYLRETVERGIPPHVTILFPFVTADELDTNVLDTLETVYAGESEFAFTLDRVETFPTHAWLAPEPAEAFLGLIAVTRACFPSIVPYGDESLYPVPHLTVAGDPDPVRLEQIAEELREALAPALPLRASADAIVLLVEQDDRTWVAERSFRLSTAA